MEVLVFLYPIIMGGIVVIAGIVFTLYHCLPRCWRKCKEAECDVFSDIYCKPDCSCCRNIVTGVLDSCSRLKTQSSRSSTESSQQNTNPVAFVFESDLLADRVQIPISDTAPANNSRPSLTRTSSEPILHDNSHRHGAFGASPCIRDVNNHRHDIFHATPRPRDLDDDDLDYIGDDLEIPERIEIDDAEINLDVSYSIENETDRENNRDTENQVDAPPSYNEATAADPPFVVRATAPSFNDTILSIASEHPSLPTYDDFITNKINYTKKS